MEGDFVVSVQRILSAALVGVLAVNGASAAVSRISARDSTTTPRTTMTKWEERVERDSELEDDTDAEDNLWNKCQRSQSIRVTRLEVATIDKEPYKNVRRFGEPSNSGYKKGTIGWETFTLNKKFSSVSFDVGHLDLEKDYSSTLEIYLDGDLAYSTGLNPGMGLTHCSIGVAGVKEMKIITKENGACYGILHGKII